MKRIDQENLDFQSKLDFLYTEEFRIDKHLNEKLRNHLNSCFPDFFLTRIYNKQILKARIIVEIDSMVIGHLGIEHRVVSIDGEAKQIFGVVDLCVSEQYRNRQIGTSLLNRLYDMASESQIDYIFLFADDHRIYFKNDYYLVNCYVYWLAIDEHKSCGLFRRYLANCLLINPISSTCNKNIKTIDLLGYLF